jgi:hypothetical protein
VVNIKVFVWYSQIIVRSNDSYFFMLVTGNANLTIISKSYYFMCLPVCKKNVIEGSGENKFIIYLFSLLNAAAGVQLYCPMYSMICARGEGGGDSQRRSTHYGGPIGPHIRLLFFIMSSF